MTIHVCNKHHRAAGEYIGRGSPLGNPFTHIPSGTKALQVVGSRDEACDRYEAWLSQHLMAQTPSIIKELARLADLATKGDLNLICFCAPQRCHGDTVKTVIEQIIKSPPSA